MDQNGRSLQHLLIKHEVSLTALCQQFHVDEQTVFNDHREDPYGRLLTTLTEQNQLPELYRYLDSNYPQVQWRNQVSSIFMNAQRDIDLQIHGDLVSGNKINNVSNFNVAQTVTTNTGTVIGIQKGLTTEQVKELFKTLQNDNQPKVWGGRIPYLGLSAFQESDAEFFFGREALIDELLERVKQANFITVAGPSGSGKSSLARAGLLHALRNGRIERSDQWLLATMTPGNDPLEQLAQAVEYATQSPPIGDALREKPDDFARYAEISLRDDKRRRFVLLVDQFEETFTQTKDVEKRAQFIQLLTEAVQAENSRIKIIISLRSDFISTCAVYPELRKQINEQFRLVGAMLPKELAKAITLPSLAVGAEIDPALVSRIINDMKGEPGALPLMSFALRDLFTALKNKPGEKLELTLKSYTSLGGLEHALERHAEKVFATFTPEQQLLAKNIFSKLVEVGQGRVDTRRIASLTELIPAQTTPEAVLNVVDALAGEGARLITTRGQLEENTTESITVTIAHERLIDAWPWLRQLVDENRELIALQNQITHDAQAWATKKDEGFLYRGGRLLQIEEKLNELAPNLNSLAAEFIQASIQLRQNEERKIEDQRQRELAQQQALAAEQSKRAEEAETSSKQLRQRRNVAFGMAGIAVFLAIVAFILFGNAQESATEAQTEKANAFAEATRAVAAQQTAEASEATANRQRTIADVQSMLALSTVLISDRASPSITQTERSLLMAVQAIQTNENLEAHINLSLSDNQLRNMLDRNYRPPWTVHFEDYISTITSVVFSPDGLIFASASDDYKVRLWDVTDLTAPPMVLEGHTNRVSSVAFSPDGHILASAGGDNTIRLWDVINPTAPPTILVGHTEWIRSVAFSPDGHILASAGSDNTIRLWNMTNPATPPTILVGHNARVLSVAFSPDSITLASASDDQTIRLWDMTNTTIPPTILKGHTAGIWSLAFAPNGLALASASDDQTIRLWDMTTPTTPTTILVGHTGYVSSVAFSPDSRTLASAGGDRTIRLWDMTNLATPPTVLVGHTGWVRSVIFSPDGRTLASASGDILGDYNTIRLWDDTSSHDCSHIWGILFRQVSGIASYRHGRGLKRPKSKKNGQFCTP